MGLPRGCGWIDFSPRGLGGAAFKPARPASCLSSSPRQLGCCLQNQSQGQDLELGLESGAPPFGRAPWKWPLVHPTDVLPPSLCFQKDLLIRRWPSPGRQRLGVHQKLLAHLVAFTVTHTRRFPQFALKLLRNIFPPRSPHQKVLFLSCWNHGLLGDGQHGSHCRRTHSDPLSGNVSLTRHPEQGSGFSKAAGPRKQKQTSCPGTHVSNTALGMKPQGTRVSSHNTDSLVKTSEQHVL